MSENWKKILDYQEEERKKIIERQRVSDLKDLQRKQEQLKKEQSSQQQKIEFDNYRAGELKKLSQGKVIAINILQEIRRNSNEVRRANFSDIRVDDYNEPEPTRTYSYVCDSSSRIYLRWGNKLKLTSEEKEILDRFAYKNDNWHWMYYNKQRALPDKFNGEDYSSIGVYIDLKKAQDVIANSSILMRDFASQLIKPSRCLITYVKGIDYLKPPPTYSEPPSRPGPY